MSRSKNQGLSNPLLNLLRTNMLRIQCDTTLQHDIQYKWKYSRIIEFGGRGLNHPIKFRQYTAPGDHGRLGLSHCQI